MSARPDIPAEDLVTVEIDGKPYQAARGTMIIEVTDAAGIEVPRFCYHKKLPIAANCRMCLVQVEKAPKPLPACATPVADGMKISTRSEFARNAQKAVMEFLLINHPLDCPICDQGGECELQDLALGYGRGVSRFAEGKRVVKDKNIGPLIATDMTRCILCTRCVRFLEVIAGHKELGGTGRGENVEIGTYIERAIESELSGNVIDVCPVGALTSKPFRFRARAWELSEHAGIAAHDAMGSNLLLHTLRGKVMRVVPRENEAINEVWLADRDRFSYAGLYSADRVAAPMVRQDGVWRETGWDAALAAAVAGLRKIIDNHDQGALGVLVSPTATLEEMYLLRRLADGLGCSNIDHRLRQADFSDQDSAPLFPWLGQTIEALESRDAVLLIGSNVRKEQPIAAHRLRKASLAGAGIMVINPVDFDFHFAVAHKAIVRPSAMVGELAAVAAALLAGTGKTAPAALQALVGAAQPADPHRAMADALREARGASVLLGSLATAHPDFATLRSLAALIAALGGATLGYLPEAANSAGGWLAGVLPHRGAAHEPRDVAGLHARAMLEAPRRGYLLFGVEPEFDTLNASLAHHAMQQAESVVVMAPFASDATRAYANVILPIAPFSETSGTFVNAEGRWQSFAGAASPVGESRPGWKALRVLGNLLELDGFDYLSSEAVRDELRGRLGDTRPDNSLSTFHGARAAWGSGGLERVGEVPGYALDPLVRRAAPLQQTADAAAGWIALSPADAQRLNLRDADQAEVGQETGRVVLQVRVDARVPAGAAWLPAASRETAELGMNFGTLTVKPV